MAYYPAAPLMLPGQQPFQPYAGTGFGPRFNTRRGRGGPGGAGRGGRGGGARNAGFQKLVQQEVAKERKELLKRVAQMTGVDAGKAATVEQVTKAIKEAKIKDTVSKEYLKHVRAQGQTVSPDYARKLVGELTLLFPKEAARGFGDTFKSDKIPAPIRQALAIFFQTETPCDHINAHILGATKSGSKATSVVSFVMTVPVSTIYKAEEYFKLFEYQTPNPVPEKGIPVLGSVIIAKMKEHTEKVALDPSELLVESKYGYHSSSSDSAQKEQLFKLAAELEAANKRIKDLKKKNGGSESS